MPNINEHLSLVVFGISNGFNVEVYGEKSNSYLDDIDLRDYTESLNPSIKDPIYTIFNSASGTTFAKIYNSCEINNSRSGSFIGVGIIFSKFPSFEYREQAVDFGRSIVEILDRLMYFAIADGSPLQIATLDSKYVTRFIRPIKEFSLPKAITSKAIQESLNRLVDAKIPAVAVKSEANNQTVFQIDFRNIGFGANRENLANTIAKYCTYPNWRTSPVTVFMNDSPLKFYKYSSKIYEAELFSSFKKGLPTKEEWEEAKRLAEAKRRKEEEHRRQEEEEEKHRRQEEGRRRQEEERRRLGEAKKRQDQQRSQARFKANSANQQWDFNNSYSAGKGASSESAFFEDEFANHDQDDHGDQPQKTRLGWMFWTVLALAIIEFGIILYLLYLLLTPGPRPLSLLEILCPHLNH